MLFYIGVVLTLIMLSLLPNTSFKGNRKITTLFIITYSLMYFYILQYGLTLTIHPFSAAAILMLYLASSQIYINHTLGLKNFLKIVLFIAVPIALSFIFSTGKNQFHFIDIFIIALIIAMNQFRLIKVPLLYQANTIEFYGLSLTFHLLILYIFLGYRRIDINITSLGTVNVWIVTLGLTFLCCLFAALIGYKLKYLSFNLKEIRARNLFILIIFNFFHVAIAEEIIFRGFVFNYLRQFIGGEWIPLILATLLFGCHHISFGGKKLFVLSSIAGFFYGLTYLLTKNIFAAAFVHTITNIIWRSFFVIRTDLNSLGKPAIVKLV
ncbi:caax protease self-immunity [Lucifera butyrica]|uniref:Caax protease self-immunity n=1 Tax=Lucifera butyrica TaxID=1351585 RepID=A0A498RDA7_9FIRM|nr:CPBP family intramembrane glutamic endopeptidase [Lucifera butyrica]VBB07178.1 caax protease self-immunity [Lucifera butyrica]